MFRGFRPLAFGGELAAVFSFGLLLCLLPQLCNLFFADLRHCDLNRAVLEFYDLPLQVIHTVLCPVRALLLFRRFPLGDFQLFICFFFRDKRVHVVVILSFGAGFLLCGLLAGLVPLADRLLQLAFRHLLHRFGHPVDQVAFRQKCFPILFRDLQQC